MQKLDFLTPESISILIIINDILVNNFLYC
jgi:hypothetical protein